MEQQIRYQILKGWKYRLLSTVKYWTNIEGYEIKTKYIALWESGELFVFAGYAWDGASGPAPDVKSIMRASLVHDACYQLLREGELPQELRKSADLMLYEICLEDGMPELLARAVYWAVRIGGKKAAKIQKKKNRDVLIKYGESKSKTHNSG